MASCKSGPKGPTPIEFTQHKDTRKNIPTQELRGFVKDDEGTGTPALSTRPLARSVLGRALMPSAAGLGIGMAATFFLTPALDILLFQVPARDWVTLGFVLGFLVIVAGVACLVPARRAVRIDPVVALRQL